MLLTVLLFSLMGDRVPAGPAARGARGLRRRAGRRSWSRGCAGTPLAGAAAAYSRSQTPPAPSAVARACERSNLILVLLIAQVVQVLLLSVSVFAFFVVFGSADHGPRRGGPLGGCGRHPQPVLVPQAESRAAAGVGVPVGVLRALLHGVRRDRRQLPQAVLHRGHRPPRSARCVPEPVYRSLLAARPTDGGAGPAPGGPAAAIRRRGPARRGRRSRRRRPRRRRPPRRCRRSRRRGS